MITLHVGFDDTDSLIAGCTTYIAALLVESFLRLGVSFIDYPNLIRLNPNVPWKTRGNGALCLRIKCKEGLVNKIMEITIDIIERNAEMTCEGTNPGIVFVFNKIDNELKEFSKQTIQDVVTLKDALILVENFGAEAVGFNSGRGIIGGLAAIGATLEGDHSYEIITYRTLEKRGTPRKIDSLSVMKMNEKTTPFTFNNVCLEGGRILITPRGPDPILYGIRGETSEIVRAAHDMVNSGEKVERWLIFRTNQGTDAHLKRVNSISEIKPLNSVIVRGVVTRQPQIIQGRHVIFSLGDKSGEVDCAAYEPTGFLRKTAKRLIIGDIIEAYGGVRSSSLGFPKTVNLEKIRIINLVRNLAFHNPNCPRCGKRMKSKGKEKGFRCKNCKNYSSTLKKSAIETCRDLELGLYITSPHSQRHLTKPYSRYGQKNHPPHEMVKGWHFP
jgi:tRNA(Ile2)-agmatinylcytidine synthase